MSDRKDKMNNPTADFLKADFSNNAFIKDYQVLAQQSWEAMVSQLQKPPRKDDFINTVFPADSTASVTLEHALSGLKSYAEWMQGAATSVSSSGTDWSQQLEQFFGKGRQPFAAAFTGLSPDPGSTASAPAFPQQWLAWLQSLQNNAGATAPAAPPFASFSADPEQLAEQQRLLAAITEHLEAANRYQRLIQRSNEKAIEKMRARLAPLAEPTARIESLKMLYDVWVECAEEAHAEIALSDEFCQAYAAMVNTQMRVRHLQQAQTEKFCQQMGMPTRSDVDNLGERLHALRRELRGGAAASPHAHANEVTQLRQEVAELRALITGREAAVPVVKQSGVSAQRAAKPAKPARPAAVKKAASKVSSRTLKVAVAVKKASPLKLSSKATGAAGSRRKK